MKNKVGDERRWRAREKWRMARQFPSSADSLLLRWLCCGLKRGELQRGKLR